MREHHLVQPLSNDISCENNPYSDCSTMERQSFSSSGDASFTKCDFISCNNNQNRPEGDGGAISYSVLNGHLIVTSCYFFNCIAYQKEGGAIDVRDADYATISSSSFVNCQTHLPHSGIIGGGGINLRSIQQIPLISLCIFISCSSGNDGGGASIWDFSSSITDPICSSCCFIGGTTGDAGAGVILYNNTNPSPCSNCLFSSNDADFGGAIYIYYVTYPSNSYPIQFCFFHANSASKYGNDVAIENFLLNQDNPIINYSFSTVGSNRLAYHDSGWHNTTVDWLP